MEIGGDKMDELIDFFRVLILSSMVAITPSPITIGVDGYQVDLDQSITAITEGAQLEIDVTGALNLYGLSILDAGDQIQSQLIEKSVYAELTSIDGREYIFYYYGGFSSSRGEFRITLHSKDKNIRNISFKKLTVFSKTPLEGVMIHWRNYRL